MVISKSFGQTKKQQHCYMKSQCVLGNIFAILVENSPIILPGSGLKFGIRHCSRSIPGYASARNKAGNAQSMNWITGIITNWGAPSSETGPFPFNILYLHLYKRQLFWCFLIR